MLTWTSCLVFLTVLLHFIYIFACLKGKYGLFQLPALGHLISLGTSPHLKLFKLGQQYGPLLFVQLGSFKTIVINDGKLIRRAFSDPLLCDRPNMCLLQDVSMRGKGIICAKNGPDLTNRRKFLLRHLHPSAHDLQQRLAYETAIENHVVALLTKLEARVPVNVQHLFHPFIINTLVQVIFGKQIDYSDPLIDHFAQAISRASNFEGLFEIIGLYVPKFSQFFPNLAGHSQRIKTAQEIQTTVRGFLDELKKETANQSLAALCMRNINFFGVYENLVQSLTDLFVAGMEATCNQLEWIIFYMAKSPQIQAKLQTEIDSITSKDRAPSFADRAGMPYTEATISEAMRAATIGPLGFMHSSSGDSEFQGQSVPKDTILLGNLYAAHYNPQVWQSPEEFKPERFLCEKGKLIKHVEDFLPFSSGRRACIGETLARQILFIYTARIFQNYNVRADGKLPTGRGFGISVGPKPFRALFTPRCM